MDCPSSGALTSSAFATPPGSPRPSKFNITTPPRLPRHQSEPPLLRALQADSLDLVRCILQKDPEAAILPFMEDGTKPELPLCCAARLGCSLEIIDLLLQHGAQADEADLHGRTPLEILAPCASPVSNLPVTDLVADHGRTHACEHTHIWFISVRH